MNKIKIDKWFCFGVSIVLLLYMGLSIYSLKARTQTYNESQSYISWGKLYPFEHITAEDKTNIGASNRLNQKWNKLINTIKRYSGKIQRHIWRNDAVLSIGYYVDSFFSNTEIREGYLKMDNGYWVQRNEETDLSEYALNYIELTNWTESQGIPTLFVQPSIKEALEPLSVPYGCRTYRNDNVSSFIVEIMEQGIEMVDLRNLPYTQGTDPYEWFYKGDHHWKPELAFLATQEIVDALNELYGKSLDTQWLDADLYDLLTFKSIVFTSVAREVGSMAENPEDYSIFIPKFNTDFHITSLDDGVDKQGTFNDVMIDYKLAQKLSSGYEDNASGVLLYGNSGLVEIKNNKNKAGIRVLLIRDSFANAVAPYLAMTCAEVDLIDVRNDGGNFTGSIRTYIKKKNPDIIIFLQYYPQNRSLN